MVLNPGLYAALKALNGGKAPRVSNAGVPATFTVTEHNGKKQIHGAGEQYAINCVNCSDTRCRLYVHHCFGQIRHVIGYNDAPGGPLYSLAYCQNEGKRIQLQGYLEGYVKSVKDTAAGTIAFLNSQSSVAPVPAQQCPSMGNCVPIHEVDPRDPAVQYLVKRGYSVEYLGRVAGAVLMLDHPDGTIKRITKGRIGFPFMVDGVMRTWQARAAYELKKTEKWPPKWWFPGGAGSKVPWNVDMAASFPVVIVTEGILSAVNMGPAAIAVGGKTVTSASLEIIKRKWKKAIVALDPDAGINRKPSEADFQARAIAELTAAGLEVCGVQWTPGDLRDPGDLTIQECLALLRKSCPLLAGQLSYVGVSA